MWTLPFFSPSVTISKWDRRLLWNSEVGRAWSYMITNWSAIIGRSFLIPRRTSLWNQIIRITQVSKSPAFPCHRYAKDTSSRSPNCSLSLTRPSNRQQFVRITGNHNSVHLRPSLFWKGDSKQTRQVVLSSSLWLLATSLTQWWRIYQFMSGLVLWTPSTRRSKPIWQKALNKEPNFLQNRST